MPIRKITIAGCGLIGGSLGAGLRTAGFAGKITGVDRPEVLDKALRLGAIDVAEPALENAVHYADLVVLATPISSILALLPVVARHSPANALITDTGSTKAEIVAAAKALFGASAAQRFLAGHPIAGKERSGIEQADPYLFRGAKWVFTPIEPVAQLAGHDSVGSLDTNVGPAAPGWAGERKLASTSCRMDRTDSRNRRPAGLHAARGT